MNWDCFICGDEFALNPRPTKHPGKGTVSNGNDTFFLCPAHTDEIWNFLKARKDTVRREAVPSGSHRATPVGGNIETYPQHPRYEEWKSICPQCGNPNTRHLSGSHEHTVILFCDCGYRFTLKEAFFVQYKHATGQAAAGADRNPTEVQED